MNHAARAYAKVATETLPPRELEATLLLTAAAKLQAALDSWPDKVAGGFDEAVLYNRRLWVVFIDAVSSDDNKLPVETRTNLLRLGVYIMGETFSLMTDPKPEHLANIVEINRGIAKGLRSKTQPTQAKAG
jgi:flagellar protein FlaF